MPDNKELKKINRELEEKVAQERAKILNLPYIDVASFPLNPDILHLVPLEDAKRAKLMLFAKIGKKLRAAISDPENLETKQLVSALQARGFNVEMHFASTSSLEESFKFYQSEQYKLKEEVKNVVNEEEIQYEKELENLAKFKDQLVSMPAEEALNLLHVSAIKSGASDIHYQPEENECIIRFRIDGVLHVAFTVNKSVYAHLANQIKYKAGMKLNLISVPQDGRFRFIVNERQIDVRVSSLPTEYGESFVCRILDSGKHFGSFEDLGFSGNALEVLQKTCTLTHGMVLVTGPTSSGKTTTLYVLLTKYNKPELKIITLEDPVEYHLKGITQSQVNEKRGFNFADGLKSILRQDPDIVMIGEVRDLETAQVCTQAALTGHVVLSTLHTNSAAETIPRLITIGLPSFMIAPALSTIVAQRLVRRVCNQCKQERAVTEKEKMIFEKILGSGNSKIPNKTSVAKGCEACSSTGFRGQFVVAEALYIDDEMRDVILANKPAGDIHTLARKKGMTTMYEDGIKKVADGDTTLDELHRVING